MFCVKGNDIRLSYAVLTAQNRQKTEVCFITDKYLDSERWTDEWRHKYGRKECVQVIRAETDSSTYTTTEEEGRQEWL